MKIKLNDYEILKGLKKCFDIEMTNVEQVDHYEDSHIEVDFSKAWKDNKSECLYVITTAIDNCVYTAKYVSKEYDLARKHFDHSATIIAAQIAKTNTIARAPFCIA